MQSSMHSPPRSELKKLRRQWLTLESAPPLCLRAPCQTDGPTVCALQGALIRTKLASEAPGTRSLAVLINGAMNGVLLASRGLVAVLRSGGSSASVLVAASDLRDAVRRCNHASPGCHP